MFNTRAKHRHPVGWYLLALLVVPGFSGCLDDGLESIEPPAPSEVAGPEPETIVTDSQGRGLSQAEAFFRHGFGPRPGLSMVSLNVSALTFVDVVIPADFAHRGLAEGLSLERVGYDGDRNNLVRGLVYAFHASDGVVDRNDPLAANGGAFVASTTFWTAAVVRPQDHLRNTDAALHVILLDVFTTDAALTGAWAEWSPSSNADTQPIFVDQLRSPALMAMRVEAPEMFRLNTEVAFPVQDAPARTIRVFGVEDNRVTTLVDVELGPRQAHQGHGTAAKLDAGQMSFPPAAGFARLDLPPSGQSTFRMHAAASLPESG